MSILSKLKSKSLNESLTRPTTIFSIGVPEDGAEATTSKIKLD